MAANDSGQPGGRVKSTMAAAVAVLGGAVAAMLLFGAVIAIWILAGQDNAPPPPEPPIVEPSLKVEAWWESLPDSNLSDTVAQIKELLPQEQSLFDSLGDTTELRRGCLREIGGDVAETDGQCKGQKPFGKFSERMLRARAFRTGCGAAAKLVCQCQPDSQGERGVPARVQE